MRSTLALLLSAAAVSGAAIRQTATEHKVYVDTSACANSGKTLPQFKGISTTDETDFLNPERFDGPTFTFTVPSYYKGHLWLYDSDNQAAQGTAVQGPDVFFLDGTNYVELLAEGVANADGIVPSVPNEITSVRFAGTHPSSLFIEGKTGGRLNTTNAVEALYVTYC